MQVVGAGVFATQTQGVAAAVDRRNHADGERVVKAERVAHGNRPLADAHQIGIAQLHRRQVGRVDFNHGDVGALVASQHLGLGEFASVRQGHSHGIGAFDDVGVGQNQAVRAINHARTQATAATVALHLLEGGLRLFTQNAALPRVLLKTLFAKAELLLELLEEILEILGRLATGAALSARWAGRARLLRLNGHDGGFDGVGDFDESVLRGGGVASGGRLHDGLLLGGRRRRGALSVHGFDVAHGVAGADGGQNGARRQKGGECGEI